MSVAPPSGAARSGADVLKAGLLLSMGMPDKQVARFYGDKVADAASARGMRTLGLHGVMRAVLQSAGAHVPQGGFADSDIQTVFEIGRGPSAGVSTMSLPGILADSANKMALASFEGTTATWPKFCRRRPAKDLKAMSSYRLTAVGRLEEVGADGRLKDGQLTESSQSNQVRTYGRVLSITRRDLINDDLEQLANVPPALGRLGSVTLERAVYTKLLSNPSNFFHADNANLLTGAGSALALAGLDDAVEAFAEMKDAGGDPILIPPAVLLVPSPLHATARSLMNSAAVVSGNTTPAPDGNPWQGFLDVVSSPYLGATVGLTGYSDAAWYVLAAPGDYAIMEVAFLNGVEVPTVQTAEADFDTLGIQMRVVYDFGVGMGEPKGGVKSNGS